MFCQLPREAGEVTPTGPQPETPPLLLIGHSPLGMPQAAGALAERPLGCGSRERNVLLLPAGAPPTSFPACPPVTPPGSLGRPALPASTFLLSEDATWLFPGMGADLGKHPHTLELGLQEGDGCSAGLPLHGAPLPYQETEKGQGSHSPTGCVAWHPHWWRGSAKLPH